jgi:hypothetical protein
MQKNVLRHRYVDGLIVERHASELDRPLLPPWCPTWGHDGFVPGRAALGGQLAWRRMSSIHSRFFGVMDAQTKGTGLHVEAVLKLGQYDVTLDLNTDGLVPLEQDRMSYFDELLDGLPELVERAERLLADDAAFPGSTTNEFIEYHLRELDDAALAAIFGTANRPKITSDQFLRRLRLHRVGLYPEAPEESVVLDFMLSPDHSDAILVVRVSDDGELPEDVDWES